jgi:ABC-type transport system involved in cytochrome bd biosynthesis fused ATPase/permease subunit
MLFISLNKFNTAFKNLTRFLTEYNRLHDEFAEYKACLSNVTYQAEPVKMYPSNTLNITNINISRGGFTLKYGGINFCMGTKIIIRSGSGSGKSTLLDAITGKIQGITFNEGCPENYYHTTADMYQNIREKMPSSKVTIRDYFHDESDNYVIEKYIREVFPNSEYNVWAKNLGGANVKNHIFDVFLNERISGGQKSRLILATRSYEIDTKNKSIIILDEPEQGSDNTLIIEILNKFFIKYNNKTIIMVTHMCPCQVSQLKITWCYNLTIRNGVIMKY